MKKLCHSCYTVSGIVQGVGFRPFCKNLGDKLKLTGSVRNTGKGVDINLFGSSERIEAYIRALCESPPPLAFIQEARCLFSRECFTWEIPHEFSIVPTNSVNQGSSFIPPDIATCQECLEDVADPANPRYGYPFTNCTNCGPRFTILQELPYDRRNTSMRDFPMCPLCTREYNSPQNRRFHAQPVACPLCGPQLYATTRTGEFQKEKALEATVKILAAGGIVAIKGLGGFHLACDPSNTEALETLRSWKRRLYKPFALMVQDKIAAEKIVFLHPQERRLLTSPQAPIVLCEKKKHDYFDTFLVAPNQSRLGIMLPYTALHKLLFQHFSWLVMTSANNSGEPLISQNKEALELLLKEAVQLVLWNDREIVHPLDDSVVAPWEGGIFFLRRSRGYAPLPFFLKHKTPCICAGGAEMKSTFSLSQGDTLITSPYLGDLKNLATYEFYKNSLRQFLKIFKHHPEYLAHDLHPQFLSTKGASEVTTITLDDQEHTLGIQHHHAHLASCIFEHSWEESKGPVLGIILDGTGYGPDQTIWGGEFLVGTYSSYQRCGSLHSFNLPGNEKAITEPWRCSASLLFSAFSSEKAEKILRNQWPQREIEISAMSRLLKVGIPTTSAGRLFDGLGCLLTGMEKSSYDGQAPIEMEAFAEKNGLKETPFEVVQKKGYYSINWDSAVRWILEAQKKEPREEIAGAIYRGFATALAKTAKAICSERQISAVALSGGVWQNRFLLEETWKRLKDANLTPMTHTKISPNDEGISVGQILIGQSMLEKR